MNTWLRQLLTDKGVLTENGLSRKAKIRRHKCGTACIAGLDAPLLAFEAWCDLTPLSNHGEAQALIHGRRTYDLTQRELNRRDTHHIAHQPAHTTTVLTEHLCHQPVPPDWAAPQQKATPPTADPNHIPF